MKKILLFTTVLFSLTAIHAQKKVSVKTKAGYKKINYFNLPELVSDSTHLTYKASFSDETGRKYSFGNGKFEIPALMYIWKLKLGGDDYTIEVKRLESHKSSKAKHAKRNKYKKKGSDGTMVDYYLFVYECFYNQKFNIIIKDNKIGGKVIYENNVDFETAAQFPNDFGINKLGYNNESTLKTGYNRYVSQNREKFENIARVKATIRCFNTKIKDKLNDLIAFKKVDYIIPNNKFKIKDKRFILLDSTAIYFKQGKELFNKQKLTKKYMNAHSKEVFTAFNNNYRIYKIYNDEKIQMLITNPEEREDFKYAIRINLFVSAIFSSHYKEAMELYEISKKEYEKEVEEKSKTTEMIPSFKISNKEKCFLLMDNMKTLVEREMKYYDLHSKVYSFYK